MFSVVGCLVLCAVNVLFVPQYGYIACAWGGFAGYATCMLLSYFVGQKKNPIPYDLKSISGYVLLAAVLYAAMEIIPFTGALGIVCKTLLLCVYAGVLLYKDMPVWRLLKKK